MGKLIVIEGTDGSGKATQTKLLCEKLQMGGMSIKKLDFPRYGEESSALVKLYLGGAFGKKPEDVNAYAASTFYAVDRFASYKQDWEKFYLDGGVVITDRYTTANAVHQAPKLPENEREAYVKWLFDFEYGLMGLPAPNLVIYLDVPTDITETMMEKRRADTGAGHDIHEDDGSYLRHCRQYAVSMAKSLGWHVINCTADGKMRTPEDIHGEIYALAEEIIGKE